MTIPAGVILSGGQSRRMPIIDKALAPLAGIPMIGHVIRRLEPQVGSLILNVTQDDPEYQQFGLPLVPDAQRGYHGPLAGLYAALKYVDENRLAQWLLISPCDAPFLPTDLGERLIKAAAGNQAGLVRYEGVLQATFSLWHIDVLPIVEQAVLRENKGGFKQVLPKIPHSVLDWKPASPPPFFNVNSPADLALAEQTLDRGR